MSLRNFELALILALVSSASAIAQNTASIQGAIVDAGTGKAVPGAVVIASRTTNPAARGVATSSYDGRFQIPSLPAGTYSLCVQVPGDGYLPTCHWGTSATTVMVTVGQKSTGNTIMLQAGSILKIHVDDAGQLLHQKTKDGYDPDLMMGVWNSRMFYPAHVVSKTNTAADYQLTVPLDKNLNFSIQSRHLALGDANKKPLPSNADQQAFQHASTAKADSPGRAGFSYSILSAIP